MANAVEMEPNVLAGPGGTGRIRTIQTAYEQELEEAIKIALAQQKAGITDAAYLQSILDGFALSPSQDTIVSQGSFHNLDKEKAKDLVDWDFYFEGSLASAGTQLVHGPARHLISIWNGLRDGYKDAGIPGSPAESISDLCKRINDRRETPENYLRDIQKGYRPTAGLTKRDLTPLFDARDKNLMKYLEEMSGKSQPQEPYNQDKESQTGESTGKESPKETPKDENDDQYKTVRRESSTESKQETTSRYPDIDAFIKGAKWNEELRDGYIPIEVLTSAYNNNAGALDSIATILQITSAEGRLGKESEVYMHKAEFYDAVNKYALMLQEQKTEQDTPTETTIRDIHKHGWNAYG